jgi:hypothetical protein
MAGSLPVIFGARMPRGLEEILLAVRSVSPFCGIIAVWAAAVGMRDIIRHSHILKGKLLASAGLLLGIAALLLWVFAYPR